MPRPSSKSKTDLLKNWVNIVNEDKPIKENVPFLDEYVEQGNTDFPFLSEVQDVIAVKSGKGYLIVCEDFSVFSFKKTKLSYTLIDALNAYLERGHGYRLAVIVSGIDKTTNRVQWNISANKNDDQIPYYLSSDAKKYSVYPITDTESYVHDMNPLL